MQDAPGLHRAQQRSNTRVLPKPAMLAFVGATAYAEEDAADGGVVSRDLRL